MAAADLFFLEVQWHLAYHNETLRSALHEAGVTIEACLFQTPLWERCLYKSRGAMKIERRWPMMIHDDLNLSVYLFLSVETYIVSLE